MKKLYLLILMLFSALFLSSLYSKERDKEKIDDFIQKAANGNIKEINLGKYAALNANMQDVKDFAAMLVKDHSNALQQLKTAALELNSTVPVSLDKEHQDKIDEAMSKVGAFFDKEYLKQIIDDHKDQIDDLEKAKENVSNRTLKNWIEEMIPVLNQHLEKAKSLNDQIK